MSFEKCRQCGEYGFTESHRCPSAWLVRREHYDDDDAQTVYADDAGEAAEKYADKNFADWEYPTSPIDIAVRSKTDEAWRRFEVSVEAVPEFHAHEVPEEAAATS